MDTNAAEAEDKPDLVTFLEEAMRTAQVTGEFADLGILEGFERISEAGSWRDLQLPDPLIARIEAFENDNGPLRLVHYLCAVDNEPVLMLAQAQEAAPAEATVVFSYTETTITMTEQGGVSHSLLCRRDG